MGNLLNVREADNHMDRLEHLAGEVAINVAKQLEELNGRNALIDHEVFVIRDNSAFEGLITRATPPVGNTVTSCSDSTRCIGRADSFSTSYMSWTRE